MKQISDKIPKVGYTGQIFKEPSVRARHIPSHLLNEPMLLRRGHPLAPCVFLLASWPMVDAHNYIQRLY